MANQLLGMLLLKIMRENLLRKQGKRRKFWEENGKGSWVEKQKQQQKTLSPNHLRFKPKTAYYNNQKDYNWNKYYNCSLSILAMPWG